MYSCPYIWMVVFFLFLVQKCGFGNFPLRSFWGVLLFSICNWEDTWMSVFFTPCKQLPFILLNLWYWRIFKGLHLYDSRTINRLFSNWQIVFSKFTEMCSYHFLVYFFMILLVKNFFEKYFLLSVSHKFIFLSCILGIFILIFQITFL